MVPQKLNAVETKVLCTTRKCTVMTYLQVWQMLLWWWQRRKRLSLRERVIQEGSSRAQVRANSTCLLTEASTALISMANVTVGVVAPAVDYVIVVVVAVEVAAEVVPVEVAILIKRNVKTRQNENEQ